MQTTSQERRSALDRFLEPARVQPCFEGQDDMADYAQTMPRIVRPADPDDVFSEDDGDEPYVPHPKTPTPNGKWMGIAIDACAHLIELQRLIGELDFFSAGDTGLGRLQQASERANAFLQRAGYRNEHGGSAQ